MKKFKEFFVDLVEKDEEVFVAYFKDPMGNKEKINSKGSVSSEQGMSMSLSNLSYMVDKRDVTAETGNSGHKQNHDYIMKRVKKAAVKDSKTFAKNLSKVFNYDFTDKALF